MFDFIRALEGWGVPVIVLIVLAFAFILAQLVGEIIELCGKTVPMIFKVRKWFKQRKDEKNKRDEQYQQMAETLVAVQAQQAEVKTLLHEVNMHYSTDCIAQRNHWMRAVDEKMRFVDERAAVYDDSIKEIKDSLASTTEALAITSKALDNNTKMTEDMFIESHRDRIISFADKVADPDYLTSEEQFDRIFELYEEYEEFNRLHKRVNGKVNRNMEIINKAYLYRKENGLFIDHQSRY